MRLGTSQHRLSIAGALVFVALLMAACGTSGDVAPTTDAPAPNDSVRVPVTSGSNQAPVTAVPDLVRGLADELEVADDQVSVVADESVVWPDGSLGCPEPEMAYTMAEQPGRRVVLEIDGVTYSYHAALEGGFFLCTKPSPPTALPTTTTGAPVEPTELRTTADAVAALAARLGVDNGAITVVAEENVTWPDGSIGCPQPGMSYTQALVDGRRVILAHAGVEYHYHGARTGPLSYCANPSPPSTGGSGYGST